MSSAASQPPAHASSHQSPSAFTEGQLVANLPEGTQDMIRAAELSRLLAHCTVLSPYELLSVAFPKTHEWDIKPNDDIKFSFSTKLARFNRKFTETQELYEALKGAFTMCIDGVTPSESNEGHDCVKLLHCVNTSAKRPTTTDLTENKTRLAPDLCLSFDLEEYSPDSFFSHTAVPIEFKSPTVFDPGFTATKIAEPSTGTKGKLKELCKGAAELLLQTFNQVCAHWAELPYRYMWTITIAGDIMRFWRWSTTGVLVTEAIHYLDDATPVYQLLQAIGKGPCSRMGLDIGQGMTFRALHPGLKDVESKIATIIKCYSEAASQTDSNVRWTRKAEKSSVWCFESCSMVPFQEGILEPHPQTLAREAGRISQQDNTTMGPHVLYVVSHPIWRGKGIYSRGTRCYLVVYKSTLEEKEDFTMDDVHMLKISWQFASRSREYETFSYAQDQHHGPIPHLASMVAGGYIEGATQHDGYFIEVTRRVGEAPEPDLGPSAQGNEQARGRELQWILFKQVGEKLSGFGSVKEFLQVIYDAIVAHENLYNVGVLHGDISENNVLIDLSPQNDGFTTRRGLLIDLDMAQSFDSVQVATPVDAEPDQEDSPSSDELKLEPISNLGGDSNKEGRSDLEKKSKALPEVTGTLLFMSVALQSRPVHQCWHDMESFFWLFLFVTLRHVRGVQVTLHNRLYNLQDDDDREEILQRIFHPPTRRDALEEFSDSKLDFLRGEAEFIVGDIHLKYLLEILYERIAALHTVFYRIAAITRKLRSKEEELGLPKHELPLRDVYLARKPEDLRNQLLGLMKIGGRCQKKSKELQHAHGITKSTSLSEIEIPSATQREAEKPVQGSRLTISPHLFQSQKINAILRQINLLIDEDDDYKTFPDHRMLREVFLRCIQDQGDPSPASAVPFFPKLIEDASKAVRDGLSEGTRSASESSEPQLFVQRSTSHSVSSAGSRPSSAGHKGSKRKRNQENDESQGQEKRQRLTHNARPSTSSQSRYG